jgi:hypothetical protein
MVCKFAKGCELYRKGAGICDIENGGPFSMEGKVFCGFWNIQNYWQNVRAQLQSKKLLEEAIVNGTRI